MLKRISVSIAPELRADFPVDPAKYGLTHTFARALRVPSDIAALSVGDLSNGACYPYSIAPEIRVTMAVIRGLLQDGLRNAERMTAFIGKGPAPIMGDAPRRGLMYVQIRFFMKGARSPMGGVIISVTNSDAQIESMFAN